MLFEIKRNQKEIWIRILTKIIITSLNSNRVHGSLPIIIEKHTQLFQSKSNSQPIPSMHTHNPFNPLPNRMYQTNTPLLSRVRNHDNENDNLQSTPLFDPYNDNCGDNSVQLQLLLQHFALQFLRIRAEQLRLTPSFLLYVGRVR